MTESNSKKNIALPLPVDTHVHLSLGGSWRDNAAAQLAAGVAMVRDAGDKDACLAGCDYPGLTIVRTGPAIFRQGSYGSFIGDNRDLSLAEKIAAAPGRFVKLTVTGMVSFDEYGRVGPQQWSRAAIAAIVRLAALYGKKVMAHVNSAPACQDVVAAGVDSLEHGYFIAPETLLEMAAEGISWTPTVAAMANQVADPGKRFSPAQIAVIKRNYQRHLEMILFAWENGVNLTIGTDSGSYNVPHGPSFLREMELFEAAGIPRAEVWKIATLNGRRLLEVDLEARISVDLNRPLAALLDESRALLIKTDQGPVADKTD